MGLTQLIDKLETMYIIGRTTDEMVQMVKKYSRSWLIPRVLVPKFVLEEPLKFVEETIENYKSRTNKTAG